MSAGKPADLRKKLSLSLEGNSIYEASDAFEPDRQPGSILMSYGDPQDTTGLLLLPPTSRKRVDVGSSDLRLRVIGAAPSDARVSPDGMPTVFTSPSDFEASAVKSVAEDAAVKSDAKSERNIGRGIGARS